MLDRPFGQLMVMVVVPPAGRSMPAPSMSVYSVMSVMFPEESPSHTLTIRVFSVPELPMVISVASVSKRTFSG